MKKTPFRLTPYQVQWLLVAGFVTLGYALYLRYLAIELSSVALQCDAGLQTLLCKSRVLATSLFKNSVFGIVALVIATLHVIAAMPEQDVMGEFFYADLEQSPLGDMIYPRDGYFAVPDGPGLGIEVDEKILKRYRVD